MPAEPTPAQILDLPLPDNDSGATTIRGYLVALLVALWLEGEGFSGKRPFGNSSWTYELYSALIRAGFVTGRFDQHGYIEQLDEKTADRLILAAIRSLDTADWQPVSPTQENTDV